MWICSCHAVTDGMIKEFAKKHGCAWKKMTKELKVGTQCGTCAKSAKEILEQAAGKPKRTRTKRTRTEEANSDSADSGAETASNHSDSEAVSNPDMKTQTSQPAEPASQRAVLPCGKCVCSCGK